MTAGYYDFLAILMSTVEPAGVLLQHIFNTAQYKRIHYIVAAMKMQIILYEY